MYRMCHRTDRGPPESFTCEAVDESRDIPLIDFKRSGGSDVRKSCSGVKRGVQVEPVPSIFCVSTCAVEMPRTLETAWQGQQILDPGEDLKEMS